MESQEQLLKGSKLMQSQHFTQDSLVSSDANNSKEPFNIVVDMQDRNITVVTSH
jgi:hypothetical protein